MCTVRSNMNQQLVEDAVELLQTMDKVLEVLVLNGFGQTGQFLALVSGESTAGIHLMLEPFALVQTLLVQEAALVERQNLVGDARSHCNLDLLPDGEFIPLGVGRFKICGALVKRKGLRLQLF